MKHDDDQISDPELADALEAVGADLAALSAQTGPMPADLAGRLDAALRGARDQGTVLPALTLMPKARWWRGGWGAGAAATGVAAAFIAALVVGHVFSPTTTSSPSTLAGKAPSGAHTTMLAASGRDYTAKTLPSGVLDLLGGRLAAPEPPVAEFGAPRTGSGQAGSATTSGATNADSTERSAAYRIDAGCLAELTGNVAVLPLGIDAARWQGQPAYIVVLPRSSTQLDVLVVGRGCSAHDQQLRYFARIPRPATN